MKNALVVALAMLLIIGLMVSCVPESEAVAVTGVTLDKSSITLVYGGATAILCGTVLPINATYKTVAWSSSDTSIVEVSDDGKVTPKALGTATITATAGGKNASCEVKVEYGLGGKGEAGGWIFYVATAEQKAERNWTWTYLEAAPEDLEDTYSWGNNGTFDTYESVGTGKRNTDIIKTETGANSPAAQACDNYSINGYSDWFLPSIAELELMLDNLKDKGIGSFVQTNYWSSSEWYRRDESACFKYFYSTGTPYQISSRSASRYVRAVRAF